MKMVGFDDVEVSEDEARNPRHIPEDREFANTVLWPSVPEKGFWRARWSANLALGRSADPDRYWPTRLRRPETGAAVRPRMCAAMSRERSTRKQVRASDSACATPKWNSLTPLACDVGAADGLDRP